MARKTIYSFMAVLAALLFVGCTDRFDIQKPSAEPGITFSVTVPQSGVATRSFSQEEIHFLHVLVFDENGYFVECRRAEPTTPGVFGTDMNVEYGFKVSLQASPSKRILHFVANYDFDSNPVEYGTEYSVVGHLSVGGGQEAYWQRIVLEKGIYDKDHLEDMPEKDKLVKIPLVRNFAKIVVKSDTDKFEVLGFALWNVPDKGSVAPYVLANQAFATYAKRDEAQGDGYDNNPWISRTYEELSAHYADNQTSTGYKGFLPKDASIISTDASQLTFDNEVKYIYERPFSGDETNTAIIVKGRYKNENSAESEITYYKIDLIMPPVHGVTEHYNILRNFTYIAKVVDCSSDGYQSPQEAALQPASNNFMASVVTQDVVNISDGKARLFVTYTDTTIVTEDPFVFRYKYYPNFKNSSEVKNEALSFYDLTRREPLTRDDYDEDFVVLDHPIVMQKYNVIETVEEGPWAGWHQTTIYPDTPTDEERSESVIIYQMTDDKTQVKIARTVTFHLRKPYSMILDCSANGEGEIGQVVTLNIKIPTGLRESMFPLMFQIESDKNNLTPNNALASVDKDVYRAGYMSTWYGKSIIPDNDKQSFGFTKRLFYNDYKAMATDETNSYRIIPCSFKLTKTLSVTGSTKVWIQNKYFYFGEGQSTAQFNN